MFSKQQKYLILLIVVISFSGCLNYYQRNIQLVQAYEQEDFNYAEELLSNKKWEKKKRNILLYYLNKGTVLHMLGKYKESNEYFQLADFYIEDYHKKFGLKALSYLSNPSIVPYIGENYEKLLLHYYSTLNYLYQNNLDDALVECKRMLLVNENISTYYKKDYKYHRDAFTHNLLGIIYDAQNDHNNAFIAYRNAYEIYKDDYVPLLGSNIPNQLKKDLLRTAFLNGYFADLDLYEKEFNLKFDKSSINSNSMVCFWNNGLCPIKEQNNITFLITNMGNGFILFTNIELGLSFPFFIGNNNDQMEGMIKMKFLRVSFPKFVSRPTDYASGFVKTDSNTYPFEIAENIDAIAHRTLKDRMAKELGETLLRLAIKKLAEAKVSQSNEGLGVLLNVTNTITEQADTRNWQLLPATINYSRINLHKGTNILTLNVVNKNNSTKVIDTLEIVDNIKKFRFHSFTTINE